MTTPHQQDVPRQASSLASGSTTGAPDASQHEMEAIPKDLIWTHNFVCHCGEIVSERAWPRHQAQHISNGKLTEAP